MKFEKRNFMGIELDVLVGHPDYRMLFIATQIAKASGLRDPKSSVRLHRLHHRAGVYLKDVLVEELSTSLPKDAKGRNIKNITVFFTDAEAYQMLLRGHAPASEPFRKWVTEEVLPAIEQTGKYNAADSENPIALAIMDELKSLRGEIVSLRQELQAKTFSLEAPVVEVSPYEGQPGWPFMTICRASKGISTGSWNQR
ncbi:MULTISPECIES: BRO family protein [Pseudomonas]|uniref:BRO-N domain-containing protein n=1 Tax=Pseudomonadaceae TaxID=135621 RepID=UPI0013F690A3|nr:MULTISPECIES: BRO family protein [Pseudomonas]